MTISLSTPFYICIFLLKAPGMRSLLYLSTLCATALSAGCPYMSGELGTRNENTQSTEETTLAAQEFLAAFELNETNVYMTTDSGTPIDDAVSLKAGIRGPTLLEDFIFRQKIQRFDHERVSTEVLPLSTFILCVIFLSSNYSDPWLIDS